MKIGKTTINLEDIATITDCRKAENCEEWEIKYKQGGKIYLSTREEEYSEAIGNISSKELEIKMLEIIELVNKPVETTNEQPIDKALYILKEKERANICVKANICPTCGAPLKWRDGVSKTGYLECSVDKTHYSVYDDYSDEMDDGW